MQTKITFFILILLAWNFKGFSQQEKNAIWFYDGTIKPAQKIDYDTAVVIYKNDKGKTKYEDIQDVFAVIKDKDTTIFYKQQDQDHLSQAQMLNFVKGKTDGKSYKNPLIVAGGFITGVASPFILAFAGTSTFLSPLIPLIYDVIVSSVLSDKIKNLQKDEFYMKGYISEIKTKKFLLGVIGSVAGLLVGLIAAYFVFEYGK